MAYLINVKEPGAIHTVSTPGCGTLTISEVFMDNGATDLELNRHWESKDYVLPIRLGARMESVEFEGSGECLISGAIPAALHYETRDGIIVKDQGDLDVYLQLYVIPSLSLAHDAGSVLNFGRICSSSQTQTITVGANGSVTSTNLYCNAQDTAPDSFAVHGVTGANFTVNLPTEALLFSGSEHLTVSDFTSSCPAEGCTIESGSEHHFGVGGTLTIPPNQAPGTYSGTYVVTVTY